MVQSYKYYTVQFREKYGHSNITVNRNYDSQRMASKLPVFDRKSYRFFLRVQDSNSKGHNVIMVSRRLNNVGHPSPPMGSGFSSNGHIFPLRFGWIIGAPYVRGSASCHFMLPLPVTLLLLNSKPPQKYTTGNIIKYFLLRRLN